MTVLHTQPLDDQLAAGLVGGSLNSQNFNAITSTHQFYFSVSATLARAYRISGVVWTVKIQRKKAQYVHVASVTFNENQQNVSRLLLNKTCQNCTCSHRYTKYSCILQAFLVMFQCMSGFELSSLIQEKRGNQKCQFSIPGFCVLYCWQE